MRSSLAARRAALWLYLLNTVLLTVHEIDSAYWHEWNLFGLPGGIHLFLLLHLPLLALVLDGFRRVVLWERGAKLYSYLLAATGAFAWAIHTWFIAWGHPEFHTPVSLGILWATLLVSLVQAAVVAAGAGRRAGADHT